MRCLKGFQRNFFDANAMIHGETRSQALNKTAYLQTHVELPQITLLPSLDRILLHDAVVGESTRNLN